MCYALCNDFLCAMCYALCNDFLCAMCYALCDDFLCVMRDVLCTLRRFPVRRGACSVGPLKDLGTLNRNEVSNGVAMQGRC